MVAALFVEKNGVYYGLPNVDPWPEERDARLYAGPDPVIAHPPCNLWVNFAALNFNRYGGEHNRPGNDGGMFDSAIVNVERWGGVLEHPAGSHAWAKYGLHRPKFGMWTATRRGWTTEVWQSAYGHKARKRTWLYATIKEPIALNWSQDPGTHQIGWFDRNKPTLSKKEASRTPIPFRDLLISIAESCR